MNKQIEEIQGLLFCYKWEQPFTDCEEDIKCMECIAKQIYNAGYQKVDKDKQVVLSREEYNRLLACEHNLNVGRESYRRMEERAYKTIEELNQELSQERKETAEKILNKIYQKRKFRKDGILTMDDLNELAREHEVEIKE